jgi:hypothetical protein
MTAERPRNPAENDTPPDPAWEAAKIVAGFKTTVESAIAHGSNVDPRLWESQAIQYLREHYDHCVELYRRLWAEYVKQEIRTGRTVKKIRLADKENGPDCPQDPFFSIVNEVIKQKEGSNLRMVETILDDCESGVLNCKPD